MACTASLDSTNLRLAREFLSTYDLPPAHTITPIRHTNNAVFEVRTGGARFVLRIHRPEYRSAAQIRTELWLLQALADRLHGLPMAVPQPVANRTGVIVVEVTGADGAPRHGDLLTWVHGRVLRPGRGLGRHAVSRIGLALAHLHSVAEQLDLPPRSELPRWDADGLFGGSSYGPVDTERLHELTAPADRGLFDAVVDRTHQLFDRLAQRDGGFGPTHHDFILGNLHLRQTRVGWQVGVIDFDDCGLGFFLYDMAPLLGNLADFPQFPALRQAFLDGYRSVRQLPPFDEAQFPLLMAARHATSCLWVIGVEQTTGAGPDAAGHIAYRMERIRHCLALEQQAG